MPGMSCRTKKSARRAPGGSGGVAPGMGRERRGRRKRARAGAPRAAGLPVTPPGLPRRAPSARHPIAEVRDRGRGRICRPEPRIRLRRRPPSHRTLI
eukprot:3998267-Alexandrium_andersonii.AAC.1